MCELLFGFKAMASPQLPPPDEDDENSIQHDLSLSETSSEDEDTNSSSARTAVPSRNGMLDTSQEASDNESVDSAASDAGDSSDQEAAGSDSGEDGEISDNEDIVHVQNHQIKKSTATTNVNRLKIAKLAKFATVPKLPLTGKPSYEQMIIAALTFLNERNGSSVQAIKKYCETKFVMKSGPHFSKALMKAVEHGAIVQTKGKGATGSFKLSAKIKQSDQRAAKKPVKTIKLKAKVTATGKAGRAKKKATDVNANVSIDDGDNDNADDDVEEALPVKRGRPKKGAATPPKAKPQSVAKPPKAAAKQPKATAEPKAAAKPKPQPKANLHPMPVARATASKITGGNRVRKPAASDSSASEAPDAPAAPEKTAEMRVDPKRKNAKAAEPAKAKPGPRSRKPPVAPSPPPEPEDAEETLPVDEPKLTKIRGRAKK